MKKKDFVKLNTIGLPQWTGLLIEGKPVTREQAGEIILRTSRFSHLTCSDRQWNKEISKILDLASDHHQRSDFTRDSFGGVESGDSQCGHLDSLNKRLGVLNLRVLDVNHHMIASMYGLGPHGWIGWDGEVGCHGFNLHAWPVMTEVAIDLSRIAKEWPFLEFRCQLVDRSEGHGFHEPLVEFSVSQGKVKLVTSVSLLETSRSGFVYDKPLGLPIPERGCTRAQLTHALKITRKRVNG